MNRDERMAAIAELIIIILIMAYLEKHRGLVLDYSPDQPRDKNGKWTDGGLTNAVGTSIIKSDRTELYGKPNSITQVTNAKGGIDRNYYDNNGRQFKQISNNDHGRPKQHRFGNSAGHAHDYIFDRKGNLLYRTLRKLSSEEIKENGDIL